MGSSSSSTVPMTDHHPEFLRLMDEAGWTWAQAAAALGVAETTIRSYRARRGSETARPVPEPIIRLMRLLCTS